MAHDLELTAAPAANTVAAARTAGWIHSPGFDLGLFSLSPLVGVLLLWVNAHVPAGPYIVLLAIYLLGMPHYFSSFSFFLGDDNLAHYRTRWTAFFGGPALILVAVILLSAMRFQHLILLVVQIWNVYHVAAQSNGILSIYRRLNGGPVSERTAARSAILSTNAVMAFWFVDRYPPLYGFLSSIHPAAPFLLRTALLAAALVSLATLGLHIARRSRPLSLPESTFLVSSLLLFHPFLWVPDIQQALLATLMGHFIQYLAIVWLLHARKYGNAGGSARQRLLGRISSEPLLLFGALASTGAFLYVAASLSTRLGAGAIYLVAVNWLTLVHFYLDGLIWAFKRPFVRSSIGPYLAPESRVVSR